jgi:HK97 family phage portal protein
MGLLSRMLAPLRFTTKAVVEGAPRPGPWFLPVTGGWLPADVGSYSNWWQLGHDPMGAAPSSMVEACISAYSQTIAMCPGDHWRSNEDGGRERIKNSALSRILRKPNEYQSSSDFLLNATHSLYIEGNAYALALRNDRFEIDELHLMQSNMCAPQVAQNGDIFYRLGGNDVIERQLGPNAQLLVPQRDVLHIRLHTSKRRQPFPLVGETPLMAAMMSIGLGDAMAQQQINFYMNQARPSAVLQTDLVMDKDQVQFVRDRWNEQAKGLHSGGVPILTAGLKVTPWNVAPKDAELASVMKISDERIALAFRVPLQILGIGGTPYSSTELLMQSWIASGLGFAINHVEEAYGVLFQLKGVPEEYVEFDTAALLRSAFKDRIDALVRGVQGGVLAPNEARNVEGYESVKFGDEPRVQQQLVPLSAAGAIPAAPGAPGAPPMPGPLTPPVKEPEKEEPEKKEPEEEEEKPMSAKEYNDVVAREVRTLITRSERYAR